MSDVAEENAPDPGPGPVEECLPCRGSGRVASQLGGGPAEVTCPWCGGSGRRTRGVDAQAAWASQRSTSTAADEPDESSAAAAPPSPPGDGA